MKTRRLFNATIFSLLAGALLLSSVFVSSAQLSTNVNTGVTAGTNPDATSAAPLPSVFDVRGPDGVPTGLGARTLTAAQTAALRRLEREAGGPVTAQYNGLTATPRHMFSHGRYLSAPSPAAPDHIARDFISRHRDLFRFSEGDVRNLRLKSRATIPDMGVTVLLYNQTARGLPVYKGEVLVNVNRAGQVISVGGDSFPRMAVVNAASVTPEQPLTAAYVISPERAVTLAAAELGVVGFVPQRAGTHKVPQTFGDAPRVYEDAPKYKGSPTFGDDIIVSKIIFPLGSEGRVAYKFALTTPQHSGIMWENIVDGQTGKVLRRSSLTSFQSGGGHGPGRRGTFRPDFQDLVESQNTAGTAQGKVTDTMPTTLSGILGYGRSPARGTPPSYQNPESFAPTATSTAGRGFKLSQVNARNEHPLIYTKGFGQVVRGFPDALNPSPSSPFGWFYLPTDTGGAEITTGNGVRGATRALGYNMHPGAKTRNAVNPGNSPAGDGSQPFAADLTALPSAVTTRDGRQLFSVFQSRYTEGNNVVVAEDHASDNETTHGVKGYAADRKFTAPYFDYDMSYEYGNADAATGSFPATTYPDVFPATATLFYYNNLIHDYLYSIGFTEATWNFQLDNFGKGGEGGDAVSAQVHDGSGVNNANFNTQADGTPPRMQMYLWTEAGVRRADGDFDFDVVQHEYYHGVSNRSAGKGDVGCLGLGIVVNFPSEAGGQGEGWGDYQAESLTDDDVTGEFVTGEFDRGIRALPMNNFRWSYAAINRRVLTRRDQQPPDSGGLPSTAVPPNPANQPVFQVHHVGTIFAPMLWDMRELLIMKQKVNGQFPGVFYDGERRMGGGTNFYIGERLVQSVDAKHPIDYRESFGTHAVVPNANNVPTVVPVVRPVDIVRPGLIASEIQAEGNRQGPLATAVGRGARLADTLVLRGLQLSPCGPSIVDTRDSILLADRELTGGENRAVIWRAFASHGVGLLATSSAGTGTDVGIPNAGEAATTTVPAIVEDFSVPAGVTACEQQGPLAAPSFTLSNTTPNTVTINITPLAGANKYIVSRSQSAEGPFVGIGETTSPTFNDNNGGGGLALNQTYFYQVRATRDAEANCVSTANTESINVTVGVDIQPAPVFFGVERVEDPGDGRRLIVSWNPATSVNPNAAIVYDVYREDTVEQGDGTERATFEPTAANRVGEGLSGTSFTDSGRELGNVYYYIVQARDTNAGKLDTNGAGNRAAKFNAPTVPEVTDAPPFALETFETSAADARFAPPLVASAGNPNQATAAAQRVTGEALGGMPSAGKMYAPEFSPGHEASPGNCATANGCGGQSDFSATIGPFTNLTPTSIMEFDHSYNSEEFFDGGVIEISVGDPSFQGSTPYPNNTTVFDAGNFIVEGGYKSPLDGTVEGLAKLSALQGRFAYSGIQSRQKVRVALNDFAPGRTHNPDSLPVYIRFRQTSDVGTANGVDAGWYVDNLVVNNLSCRLNVASAAAGATATASSVYPNGDFSPAGAIDGERTGINWGNGGGWGDGTRAIFPDWLEVNLGGSRTVDEVRVYTLRDGYYVGEEPDETTGATTDGLVDFDVQTWNGSAWVTVPGGAVRGNDRARRSITFPAVTTDRVRVLVLNARNNFSRVVELEAYGCASQ